MFVRRTFVDDLAQCRGTGDPYLELSAARGFALDWGWPLILGCDIDLPVVRRVRAELMEAGIEYYDLGMLEMKRDALGDERAAALLHYQPRHGRVEGGRKAQKAEGAHSGRRDTGPARLSSLRSRRGRASIRQREFVNWCEQARRDDAQTPEQIAEWLNARGSRTAQGYEWTEANVREWLKKSAMVDPSEREEEAQVTAQPTAPISQTGSDVIAETTQKEVEEIDIDEIFDEKFSAAIEEEEETALRNADPRLYPGDLTQEELEEAFKDMDKG